MPLEIERKYLIANNDWTSEVSHSVRLRDGLIAHSEDRKVRVRFYDDRATLTIKGPRHGLSRDEFEYEIPAEDGLRLLTHHCVTEILEKTRYHISFGGFDWTVDQYHGRLDGVVLAEIELPSEECVFPKPAWLGREVTGEAEYRKINMLAARRAGDTP